MKRVTLTANLHVYGVHNLPPQQLLFITFPLAEIEITTREVRPTENAALDYVWRNRYRERFEPSGFEKRVLIAAIWVIRLSEVAIPFVGREVAKRIRKPVGSVNAALHRLDNIERNREYHGIPSMASLYMDGIEDMAVYQQRLPLAA